MKTQLHLINANFTIDLMIKNDLTLLKSKVKEDFYKFTQGTHEDYRSADKLLYIDNIRNRLHISDFDEYVDDYVQGVLDYQRDVGILGDDRFEVEFDYDFAESVFEHSKRNFYKSGEKPILYNNLIEIIRTVMEYD